MYYFALSNKLSCAEDLLQLGDRLYLIVHVVIAYVHYGNNHHSPTFLSKRPKETFQWNHSQISN